MRFHCPSSRIGSGVPSGDLSCGDKEQPGRPLISLRLALQGFLKKFLFASARVMAGHFSMDQTAIKSILDRELGLRKFTPRWMPHILSTEQKLRRVTESQNLMDRDRNPDLVQFMRIVTILSLRT
jgi:hypothetical protein